VRVSFSRKASDPRLANPPCTKHNGHLFYVIQGYHPLGSEENGVSNSGRDKPLPAILRLGYRPRAKAFIIEWCFFVKKNDFDTNVLMKK
jgi:hypothetical protein